MQRRVSVLVDVKGSENRSILLKWDALEVQGQYALDKAFLLAIFMNDVRIQLIWFVSL